MRYQHPHTITNRMGESLTFVRLEGDKLIVENEVQPGAGPVMHVHWQQEEELEVVSGVCGYEYADGRKGEIQTGEKVLFKRGEYHRFWAAGNQVLRCRGWIAPAGNIEYFLTELYKSIDANDGKQPGAMDSVFLVTRYKSEFDVAAIPAFVKRFIFPVQYVIGKLTGAFKKFEGAPEPLP